MFEYADCSDGIKDAVPYTPVVASDDPNAVRQAQVSDRLTCIVSLNA